MTDLLFFIQHQLWIRAKTKTRWWIFYWFSNHQLWRSSLDSMVGRFGWWGGLFTPARQDNICPKFGLTTPFLRKNQIKMVPNLRQTLAGAAGGDLCGGDGVHLCHLCLRHRQDERPEVWTDSPVCNLDQQPSPYRVDDRMMNCLRPNSRTKLKCTNDNS